MLLSPENFLDSRDGGGNSKPPQCQMGRERPLRFGDAERKKNFLHLGGKRRQLRFTLQSQPDHARRSLIGEVACTTDLKRQRLGYSNRGETVRSLRKMLCRECADEF